MIEKDELVAIGKFQRTHALKGELNAIMDIDAEFLEEGYPAVLEADGIFVPFYAESVRTKGATSFLIRLEGIESEEEAKEFVNRTIYARREDLEEFMGEDFQLADDLSGYLVIDETLGEIGRISRIDDSTENALFIVETPDGEEVYIPIVDDFVIDVNDDAETITTRLPEGLVDLNTSTDKSEKEEES